ncbi:N-acetylmuramoyl-L-alanine amidase family protein [Desulforamulus hydrothermalis]|uniref:Cell wall hydrolase/autolysin n=1 Tax=Desulforamulus hydrothermalis Lam5 = DSM 18033 TaxID=1121428 RepID=K8EFG8_9FIRM|nr:N-acetylmuramoyl-L-alanine amidase [Desulforamulus hydrothermalis]CCO07421.1 Cell wall hydrolase/autolysin [Desulforamulus hydrothermalis Lam5 = DSM 18033]SHH36032.1 N-acetylmuramoyl-L-alanine amidase [Desulforamulus hydrothermalis Lam5 = DSM 18033]
MIFRLLLLIFWLVCPQICRAGEMPGAVVIDPGHGGYDPGAVRQGVMEKYVNLAIAQEVVKILQENNVRVLLTREGDYNLAVPGLHGRQAKRYDIEKRIELAETFGADAVISIHVNVGRRLCTGAETFYHRQSPRSKLLARYIQKEISGLPQMNKRVVKTGNYYILRRTPMPCVIVETGYLNNPQERKKLLDKSYRQMLARAIARGVINYLHEKDKATNRAAEGEAR